MAGEIKKKIRTMLFWIKFKWILHIVKHECWSMCLEGKPVPENYLWQRTNYYLDQYKNGGKNDGKTKSED